MDQLNQLKGLDDDLAAQLNAASGGHGRIPPADPSAALEIAKRFGTHLSPILSVSGTVLVALLAWQRQSLSPLALLLLCVAAAAQTLNIWPAFFALFSVFFLVTSLAAPVKSPGRTRASFVVASTLVATLLLGLFTAFLPGRMATIALYLLNSNPSFCLPRPSPTLQEAERYTVLVALFGQLPFGIAVSWAAATALALSSRLGSGGKPSGINAQGLVAGLMGALAMATAAAVVLPMCDEVTHENSQHIIDHIDGRAIAWGDRETIYWTQRDRYGIFVPLVALAGVAAVVLNSVLADKPVESSATKKVESTKAAESGWFTAEDVAHVRQLLANALVSGSVVVGMALWSYIGNKDDDE